MPVFTLQHYPARKESHGFYFRLKNYVSHGLRQEHRRKPRTKVGEFLFQPDGTLRRFQAQTASWQGTNDGAIAS